VLAVGNYGHGDLPTDLELNNGVGTEEARRASGSARRLSPSDEHQTYDDQQGPPYQNGRILSSLTGTFVCTLDRFEYPTAGGEDRFGFVEPSF
jgi:hypothetical protein